MAITLTLDDDLVARLENRAKQRQLSVEQFAIGILTEALVEPESETLEEIVATIRATAPNPSLIRPAAGNLADLLRDSPNDSGFDLKGWERQWSEAEAELKAITRADDIAEGRGG